MAIDVISLAWKYMRRRNFATAIKLLEGKTEVYEDNFEYFLTFGIACLYVGDFGAAVTYFSQARKIKVTDTRLLLGQAAIYLRRGDTDRALQYYMEVKDNEPGNHIANDALEFIRTRGDYDTICRWVDTGRIEQFYPPLGANPDRIASFVIPAAALILGALLIVKFVPVKDYQEGARKDLSQLALTSDEKSKPQETDLSTQTVRYILSSKQIKDSYENAQMYFQSHRDNAAQVEINRLLNSNAALSIKQKAKTIMGLLEVPSFDTLSDNPTYEQVDEDPILYLDCWVSWGGKISDAIINADGTYTCRLLVGYETGEKITGIVNVKFDNNPGIETDKPVKILGKIMQENNKVYIRGMAVYQGVKNGLM